MIIFKRILITKLPPGEKESFKQELNDNIGNYLVLSQEPRHIRYNIPVIKKKIMEIAGDIVKLQWIMTEEYHIDDLLQIQKGFIKRQERGRKMGTFINFDKKDSTDAGGE